MEFISKPMQTLLNVANEFQVTGHSAVPVASFFMPG
jgi:hypothetical protein